MAYRGDDSESDSRLGDLIFIRVTLSGYKDRSYAMLANMLDEGGRELHARGDETEITISTCESLSPRAIEDGVSWRCWIRTPEPGRSYRIRAEIYDAGPSKNLPLGPADFSGTLLDFMETEQLTSS